MSLPSAKKLMVSGGKLNPPVIFETTDATFSGTVPRRARNVEVMCVGAGFDGDTITPGGKTRGGNESYGGKGGDGGGATPRTKLKVIAGTTFSGSVGQTNGQASKVSISGTSFDTTGLVGGPGGWGGYVSIERAEDGVAGDGDAGPGGGGGNAGSSAVGGNGAYNSTTGAQAGGGASGGAAATPGYPRGVNGAGANGQGPGAGGGAGTSKNGLPAGKGAKGIVRLIFT